MGIRKAVNQRIEELRSSRGITQTEFAVALGLDEKRGRSMVNNWEQGLVQVKSDDLIKIAETFSVSADYLLGLRDDQTNSLDRQTAVDYTGLSSEAVEALRKSSEYLDLSLLSDVLELHTFTIARALTRIKEAEAGALEAIEKAPAPPIERISQLSEAKRALEIELFTFSEEWRRILSGAYSALGKIDGEIDGVISDLAEQKERRLRNGKHQED